jgi:hypothetical protein
LRRRQRPREVLPREGGCFRAKGKSDEGGTVARYAYANPVVATALGYNSLEPERRQVCWSHLRRDFTFHADLGSGPQEAFGLDGLEVTWNVVHACAATRSRR